MPYCSKCGKENSADAKFCSDCGASLQLGAPVNEKKVTHVVVQKAPSNNDNTAIIIGVVLLAVIAGGLFFSIAIDVVDCPVCNNNPLLRWACSYCGYDGQVTILEYITYVASRQIISQPIVVTSLFT